MAPNSDLGDSVVEGLGLPQTQTITAQLQKLLDERSALNESAEQIEVLNFGVSAYCTRAEIELLKTKAVSFKPDRVILVFVENDFENFNREAFPLRSQFDRPAWTEWLFKRSELFRLTSLKGNLFQFQAETQPSAWNTAAIGNDNVRSGLRLFRELAATHGFEPLVAIGLGLQIKQSQILTSFHRVTS